MNGDIHNVSSLHSLWGREPRDGSNLGWLEISVNVSPYIGATDECIQKITYYLTDKTFDPFLVDLQDQIQKLRDKLSKEQENEDVEASDESFSKEEA